MNSFLAATLCCSGFRAFSDEKKTHVGDGKKHIPVGEEYFCIVLFSCMMSQNASENMTHSRLNRVCSGVFSCVKDLKMIDHVKITGVKQGPEK